MRQNVGPRKMRHRSMLVPQRQPKSSQNKQRNIRRHASGILQPFANIESYDVQTYCYQEQDQRTKQKESSVLRQVRCPRSADVCAHRCTGQKQPRKIKNCVDPVGPSGDETVEVAEGFLGPNVQAAFLWKSG